MDIPLCVGEAMTPSQPILWLKNQAVSIFFHGYAATSFAKAIPDLAR
jgi:hypothetical protein